MKVSPIEKAIGFSFAAMFAPVGVLRILEVTVGEPRNDWVYHAVATLLGLGVGSYFGSLYLRMKDDS